MPSQDDILRNLVEEIRPFQQAIDANLRELEDQQRRNQEHQKQKDIREERYRLLAGQLVGEAETVPWPNSMTSSRSRWGGSTATSTHSIWIA
jgi:hypothetical protein